MRRVAFVVQRCGREVNGGSEVHCFEVARRCAPHLDVEILTTCALDYRTWANHYAPGPDELDGVRIRRFPVAAERDVRAFDRLSARLAARRGRTEGSEENAWMRAQGPWSPELFAYLREHRGDYDAFVFFTYLYATTCYGLPEVAERAVLVPTAHDEWPIHLRAYETLFSLPRAFVFNTPEERAFLRRRFPRLALPGEVVGVGVERPAHLDPDGFRARYGLDAPFLLYVGRIDPSKGCDELLQHHAALRARPGGAPPLVLVGRPVAELPPSPGIVYTGFVDDATKWNALAACTAVVVPSRFESLSIVLLEAWACGRPALVNGESDVLVAQVGRSGAGLFYRDRASFARGVDALSDPGTAAALGAKGERFVREQYGWDRVVTHYCELVAAIADGTADRSAGLPTQTGPVSSELPRARARGRDGGGEERLQDPQDPNGGPQAEPVSAGLAIAREHTAEREPVAGSRLGRLALPLKRVTARLLRFQTDQQTVFNQGIVDAVRETEAYVRSISEHLGAVSRSVEQLQAVSAAQGGDLGALTASLDAAKSDLQQLAASHGAHLGELSAATERLDALGAEQGRLLSELTTRTDATQQDLRAVGAAHGAQIQNLCEAVEGLQEGHGTLYETVKAQGRHLDELVTQLADFDETIDRSREEAEGFEERLVAEVQHLGEAVADLERRFRPNLHFDHFDFSRIHRGAEEDVRERLKRYAYVFGPVNRILDVGCGRGEFLEVCREIGVGAYGVECDGDMVSRCTMKALEVVEADALEHLRSLKDRSLDGIFMSQVIEHLTSSEIVDFVHLAAEKLKRGAAIVIETINPDTFSALRWFFMDLTHRQPVSPATIQFLLKDSGFTLRDVIYSSPVPDEERLQPLSLPETSPSGKGGRRRRSPPRGRLASALATYNENVERLNRLLCAEQDYAVIAER